MKWEYKTVKFYTTGLYSVKVDAEQIEEECNKLGRNGWELVTNVTTAGGQGWTSLVILIFKRPIA